MQSHLSFLDLSSFLQCINKIINFPHKLDVTSYSPSLQNVLAWGMTLFRVSESIKSQLLCYHRRAFFKHQLSYLLSKISLPSYTGALFWKLSSKHPVCRQDQTNLSFCIYMCIHLHHFAFICIYMHLHAFIRIHLHPYVSNSTSPSG